MGVLEQVTQLKKEGRSDEQIISDLRKQGISPREISDALNHSHIKSAVGDVQGNDNPYGTAAPAPSPTGNQEQQYSQEAGQDQSSYGQQNYQDYGQGQDYNNYAPQDYSQNQQYAAPAGGQEYYPQQDYSQGNYSSGYDQYGGGPQTSSDTVVEVSEQVFDEKISETAKRVDSLEEFKTLTQTKLNSVNEKVKRMEAIIDKLQMAILEKVSSYGKNLDSIKKEMSMMQDTFTKSLDPLIGKASSKPSSPTATPEKPKRTRKTTSKK